MDPALIAFGELVREPEIDLGRGALAIAAIEHPDLIADHEVKRLDELAARSAAAAIGDPLRALHRLREFLFEEEGFRGNRDEYYDPRNSCLNDVLDRRLGIPITLSVLTIEVGRRLGLAMEGIGLPGHFIVSVRVGEEAVLLDPFDAGSVVTHERAGDLVARALLRRVSLTAEHFAPVARRHILLRMLANLRSIYWQREDWQKALAVAERMVLVEPEAPALVRDRGTALVKLRQLQRGAADWERYLTRCPEAADAKTVRVQLRRLRQHLAALN
ncbi:MAG: tetratricopeptide repeat protein [Candidatus Rokubacteria bacterium]|nr:tetratricopeptide repeat protein [Candidatus Rokubacteria bacterium]